MTDPTAYDRLIRLHSTHSEQSQIMLEEMLCDCVYSGNIDMARQYLEQVKECFTGYDTWKDILAEGSEDRK